MSEVVKVAEAEWKKLDNKMKSFSRSRLLVMRRRSSRPSLEGDTSECCKFAAGCRLKDGLPIQPDWRTVVCCL